MSTAQKRWFSLGTILAVLVAAIVVLQFLGGPDQARAKQFATLDVLEGTVDVSQGGGAFSEGRDGQSLGEGDVVRTGPQGRAEIEYFDGSMTRLDWSTTFTLEELATLDNAARSKRIVGAQGAGGKTWSRVSRLTDSQSRFEVRTPTATGAVRGTIFATQCEADGTCLYVVIDGSVVVSSAKGSASLHAFDVVEVQPDGTLGEVEHLSLEELLDLFPWIALNGCVLDNVLVCSVGENPPPGEEGGGEPPAGPDTGVPTEGDTGTTGDTGIGPESEPPANNVPNAAFDASETSGPAPLEVAFTSRASDRDGDALAHHWSFGDGETSDAPTPTHTFGPGVHAVTLTVTDPDGASDSASLLISASPPGAPVIGEHPPAETTERSATFTFGGSGAAAAGLGLSVAALAPALGFECSLNGAPFVPCQSPVTYDDLLPGGHAFSVRGVVSGVAGPAAPFGWRILDQAPAAADDSLSVAEEGSAVVDALANDGDLDGDPLHVAGVGPAGHGVAEAVAGGIRYTPLANWNGSDTFTYTAADAFGGSDTATVAVTVAPVNDGPSASDDAYSTAEDTPLVVGTPGVLDDDADPDGDPLAAVAVTGPAHGTLDLQANGSFTYAPDADYTGLDAFTYRASDGTLESQTATVALTVGPVNDAPACDGGAGSTAEDVALGGSLSCTDTEGDALGFALVPGGAPSHGSLTLHANGTFTYTPAANFHGADAFTFEASDGSAESSPATYSITVTPVNDAPVCADGAGAVAEDGTLTGDVSCADVDGDALAYSKGSGPSHGTATVGADGSFSYSPAENFHGDDAFVFQASDGTAADDATFAVTVTPVNDAPVCADGSGTIAEDGTLSGSLSCSDVEGDGLAYAKVGNPAHGTLSIATDGSFSYSPAPNYYGPDAFLFSASDGLEAASGTFSIMVTSVNDAPACADDSDSTDEDTALTGSVACTDADGDGLSYSVPDGGGPAHGELSLSPNGSFTYTPDANFHGGDSFTFLASDGQQAASATFSITVDPVNDDPVAADDAYGTEEDTPLSVDAGEGVLANDTDVDGDALSATSVAPPAHGTLDLSANGSFTYTPDADFNGADGFTYLVSDGHGGTDTASVAVTVGDVNDAPVCVDGSGSTAEDTVLNGSLSCSDVDGDGLSYAVPDGGGPGHGELSLNGETGGFSYTPDANFHGSDAFTFVASDGEATSEPATFSIEVTAVNDDPVAAADVYSTDEDTLLSVNAGTGVLGNDTDADGDALSAVLDQDAAHGDLALAADGSFTYTPDADYNGQDTFTYHASDGTADSNVATVTITVGAVNDPPVCANDSGSVGEDGTLNDSVACSDADGDPLTYEVVGAGPAHGDLNFNADGSFTYTPEANYNGPDAFQFQASDGVDQSGLATYSITVNAANDVPVAADDAYSVDEDSTLTVAAPGVLGNDTDADGDALSAVLVAGPAHGTLTLNANGSFAYTAAANYHGPDSFQYQASDGTALSDAATVSITVTSSNDEPVCTDGSGTTAEDTALNGSLTSLCQDVDGDALAYQMVTGPAHGTAVVNADGSFTYTPAADYHGPDAFTFRAGDGQADSNAATFSITVTPANDTPVAADDAYSMDEDTTLTVAAPGVLANDTDADGDPLQAGLVTGPAHGSLTLSADGAFAYTPAANYFGGDGFTYRASDGAAQSNTATVSITVNDVPEPNRPPEAKDDKAETPEGESVDIDVLKNDTDPDGDTLSIASVEDPANGTATIVRGGDPVNDMVRYTPDGAFCTNVPDHQERFNYSISDGHGGTDTAEIKVAVNCGGRGATALSSAGAGARRAEGDTLRKGGTPPQDRAQWRRDRARKAKEPARADARRDEREQKKHRKAKKH